MITIAEGRYIDPKDISLVVDVSKVGSKNYLNKLKEEGLLMDITGGNKARSYIITKQGYALLTSLTAANCLKRIVCSRED